MKFVIRPRQGGKTHASVQWLLEDPAHRVLLTCNQEMAADLRRKNNLTDRQVMSAAAAQNRLRGRNVAVAVEDLDAILGRALGLGPGASIALVTATGETV